MWLSRSRSLPKSSRWASGSLEDVSEHHPRSARCSPWLGEDRSAARNSPVAPTTAQPAAPGTPVARRRVNPAPEPAARVRQVACEDPPQPRCPLPLAGASEPPPVPLGLTAAIAARYLS